MSLSVLDIFKVGLGPVEFPHDGADERRAHFRRRSHRAWPARAHGQGRRAGLRIAGADRPGSLHRPRGPARPRGGPTRHDRSRSDRAGAAAHPRVGRSSGSAAGTRSTSTSRWTCCSIATRCCRCTRTACASRRSTRRATVLHREEFYSTGGGFVVRAARVRAGEAGGQADHDALPVRLGARPAAAARDQRPRAARAGARERARVPQRRCRRARRCSRSGP